ncbi:hypothetical protein CCS01_10865 [Rhodopila globiformis]|uniref:DUF2135 domain-containing protein n=2 Tax=Rhodopila globiformis TaxID=1071 RepID=A0A2S6NIJ5_RHOGL|nr:hypothetical protein CCS01_10865 [Rhodopila globiformis]
MLDDDPLGNPDDGTFVPFTDMLFNVVIGLAFMVFIAFALINPVAKTGAIEMKAEFLITMNWPDNDLNDMDLYVEDPAGNIVWYHGREAGLMHLDHDDRGSGRERITVNGRTIQNPLNQEIVTIRGIVPGEYVVNAHEFVANSPNKIPVSIKVEKLNPTASVVYYGTHDFDHKGQEETFVRFTLDADGKVSDVETGPPVSLVKAVRRPASGNGPKQTDHPG